MVDVDAERAARIVLADNRTADLGSYDNEELLGLLNMMDGDLDGTGYDEEYLDSLEEMVELENSTQDPNDEDAEPEAPRPTQSLRPATYGFLALINFLLEMLLTFMQ